MQTSFLLYSMFFTGGHLDILMAPISTHINLSDLLIPRLVMFLFCIYLNAAWIFPHAMGFMLAKIFTCQYRELGQAFDETLYKCDKRRVSDSDIEMFRQNHQDISMHLSEADDFLMFHNAGAFCCQLIIVILLLYALIFFRSNSKDPIVLMMYIFWLFGTSSGLFLTTAGGIVVNHYVSTGANTSLCCVYSLLQKPREFVTYANWRDECLYVTTDRPQFMTPAADACTRRSECVVACQISLHYHLKIGGSWRLLLSQNSK